MSAAKIIEVMGASPRSFEDATQEAIRRVGKTVRNITGAKVISHNIKVNGGKIKEYRVNLKVAFVVD
jgi:flavin-binding protein dodecin